jgi:diacylglycerol kinase (ATP)
MTGLYFQVHSYCRIKIVDECNFGSLKDIIIPPYAVSVPRTEMNKETIFGIQLKNKGFVLFLKR